MVLGQKGKKRRKDLKLLSILWCDVEVMSEDLVQGLGLFFQTVIQCL